jgi:hypothetical protein
MSFLERLLRKGQDGDMQNYLTTLEDVLNADKRFSNIRWHFKSDYECGKENRAAISPY